MKQNQLIEDLYSANLKNETQTVKKLYQKQIQHILEKKKAGKHTFCAKWLVTDER